jgi:hypothetical protein
MPLKTSKKSKSFYSLKCEIEVQTIIYRDTQRGYNNCNFNDITLYFDTLEMVENDYGDCNDYSFNVEEAQQVIKALELAQKYINNNNLNSTENQSENHTDNQMFRLFVRRPGQKRLKLISKIPHGTVAISIDVAQNPEIPYPLIRLIFSYNQYFCFAFTASSVNQFIDGLKNAVEYSQKNRPQIIADIMIGKVFVIRPPSETGYLEIGTDGIYFEGDDQMSGVFMNIYEGENRWMSQTRWFKDDNLLEIARRLENKANELKDLQIVALHFYPKKSKIIPDSLITDEIAITIETFKDDQDEKDEEQSVKTKRKSTVKHIVRRFDDHQIFGFTKDNAKKMSKFMLDALDAKANHTPHKFDPKQPTTLRIADLPLKK